MQIIHHLHGLFSAFMIGNMCIKMPIEFSILQTLVATMKICTYSFSLQQKGTCSLFSHCCITYFHRNKMATFENMSNVS